MSIRLRWALAAALLVPTSARGQELRAFHVRGGSDHPAFPETEGAGVGVAMPLTDHLLVRADLDRRAGDLDRVGSACVNPSLRHQCGLEPIATRNTFRSLAAALLASFRPMEPVRLSAGGGIIIGTTNSESESESGRTPDTFVQRTAHTGLLVVAAADLRVPGGFPVFLFTEYEGRFVSYGVCSGEVYDYSPFCEAGRWSELKLGIGFSVR